MDNRNYIPHQTFVKSRTCPFHHMLLLFPPKIGNAFASRLQWRRMELEFLEGVKRKRMGSKGQGLIGGCFHGSIMAEAIEGRLLAGWLGMFIVVGEWRTWDGRCARIFRESPLSGCCSTSYEKSMRWIISYFIPALSPSARSASSGFPPPLRSGPCSGHPS